MSRPGSDTGRDTGSRHAPAHGMAAGYRRLATTPLAALTPEEASAIEDLDGVLRRPRS